MKIYISVDMEGVCGVIHWKQTEGCNNEYERAKILMTEEVNAAIEGAIDAGADEILVNDAHGSMRNIIVEKINPKARLVTGYPKQLIQMEGIDGTFDGAVFIGYHAMASSLGVLNHTISSGTYASIKVNDIEFGETALSAAIAGYYGVPVLAVSGDNYLHEEVKAFLPDAEFAEVKIALGYKSANCMEPLTARQLIREKVKKAVSSIEKHKIFDIQGPLELKLKLNNTIQAEVAGMIPNVKRISNDTVLYVAENIIEGIKMIMSIVHATCILYVDPYK